MVSLVRLAAQRQFPPRAAGRGENQPHVLVVLGEAGLEIRDLQRSEVGEVAEPWSDYQHSSSTMPQNQSRNLEFAAADSMSMIDRRWMPVRGSASDR